MNSTNGGHTPISFPALSMAAPSILGGKVRGLAVMNPKRSATLPSVPTLLESGLGDQQADVFVGILMPADAPRPVVDLLNREIVKALALADVRRSSPRSASSRSAIRPTSSAPGSRPKSPNGPRLSARPISSCRSRAPRLVKYRAPVAPVRSSNFSHWRARRRSRWRSIGVQQDVRRQTLRPTSTVVAS
jgi:hypothetical protein